MSGYEQGASNESSQIFAIRYPVTDEPEADCSNGTVNLQEADEREYVTLPAEVTCLKKVRYEQILKKQERLVQDKATAKMLQVLT